MPRDSLTNSVTYGDKTAKFSDADDAHAFARLKSQDGFLAEVSNKSGLIGQYEGGKATPEFKHIDDMNPNLVPHEPMTYATLVSDARSYFEDGVKALDDRSEEKLAEVVSDAIDRAIPMYNSTVLEILMSDIGQGIPDDASIMSGSEDVYDAARASLREGLNNELRGDLETLLEEEAEEDEDEGEEVEA